MSVFDHISLIHIINQLTKPRDILSVCQLNHHTYQLSITDEFWQIAVAYRYPNQGQFKLGTVRWKQYYLELVWSVMTPPRLSGTKQEWILRGQYHRLHDLPAIIHSNSEQECHG